MRRFALLLMGFMVGLASCGGDGTTPGLVADGTLPGDVADGFEMRGTVDVAAEDLAPLPDLSGEELTVPDSVEPDLVAPDGVEPDGVGDCAADEECEEGLRCLLPEGLCVECLDFQDCDLESPCSFDYCGDDHVCVHKPLDEPCSDGDPCTVGDHCSEGACVYDTLLECDDGNDCTKDFCKEDACDYAQLDGPCDDGDPCTEGDYCKDGICAGGPGAPDCDDGDPCTTDSCTPGEGCTHAPAEGACDDGDACTENDTCVEGACVGQPVSCDDGNLRTVV
jgi:hypothetical protein